MKTLLFFITCIPLLGNAQIKKDPRDSQLFKTYISASKNQLKSTSELQYALDSGYQYYYKNELDSTLGGKFIFYFNPNKTTLSYTDYYWNDNQWVNVYKYDYCMDAKENDTLYNEFAWDTITNQWINYYKSNSYYDNNNNEILRIGYEWDKNKNLWIKSFKCEEVYNPNNTISIRKYMDWSTSTQQWVNYSKTEFVYTNEQLITTSSYNWKVNTAQWIVEGKEEYSYEGKEKEIIRNYSWNSYSSTWSLHGKTENKFNTNGQLLTYSRYYIDFIDSTFRLSTIEESTYDINGHKTTFSYSYHVDSTNQMKLNYKNYYYYSLHSFSNRLSEPDSNAVKIFPNPATSIVNIEVYDASIHFCQLINSNGQLIKTFLVSEGMNNYNISNLETGLYFIRFNNKHGVISKKIIKE